MGVWVVDLDWYFHTASVLGRAASKLANAAGTVASDAVLDANSMAGNEEIGASWGAKYDTASSNTADGAVSLSRAWSALAGRIYQAGVNHAWAEAEAGRGRIPTPGSLPSPPGISAPADPALASSVGDNGPGLVVTLPGLDGAIGKPVPNADSFKLTRTATSWSTFATTIGQTVGEVMHQVRRPDPSLPDAAAFYGAIMSLGSPGDALSADAMSLSSLTSSFSAGVTTMRQRIDTEMYITAIELSGTAVVAVFATRVAGTVSIGAGARLVERRIARTGENIRVYISTLQGIASAIHAFTPLFQPTMKAMLDKQSSIPAEGFERNPDGTIKPTVRYFDRAKWEAWQRYLERGGDMDIDTWSRLYDQLLANGDQGRFFNEYVETMMGYDNRDEGWKNEYSNADIVPGRRWDFANPDLRELVENKSGRLDFDQLIADEEALQRGYNVTYNINGAYQYSASELAALERLEAEYPGQFIVNRIGG